MKGKMKGKVYLVLLMPIIAILWLAGCSASKDDGDKIRDLDSTVAGNMDVPDELEKPITEKQQQPLEFTYNDEQNLHTMVGYGVQSAGGYSISVSDLYFIDNPVVINAELRELEKGGGAGTEQSLPFVVIRMGYPEDPVILQ